MGDNLFKALRPFKLFISDMNPFNLFVKSWNITIKEVEKDPA